MAVLAAVVFTAICVLGLAFTGMYLLDRSINRSGR